MNLNDPVKIPSLLEIIRKTPAQIRFALITTLISMGIYFVFLILLSLNGLSNLPKESNFISSFFYIFDLTLFGGALTFIPWLILTTLLALIISAFGVVLDKTITHKLLLAAINLAITPIMSFTFALLLALVGFFLSLSVHSILNF